MRNIRLAEWILSLVTTPERASSTAGDLVEEGAVRGRVWFWHAVLRTVASHVWRGVTDAPGRVLGVAFAGAILNGAAGFLLAGLFGVVFFVVSFFALGAHLNDTFLGILVAILFLIISFLTGRVLARWAVGRELAACLAYVIVASACNLFDDSRTNAGVLTVIAVFLGNMAMQTPALAGAIWGRRRRARLAGRGPIDG
jgi:hypothetical protein